jgi:hypothetical protein
MKGQERMDDHSRRRTAPEPEKTRPAQSGPARGVSKSKKKSANNAKASAKESAARPAKAGGEAGVLAKIAAMPEPYRAIGERLHALIVRSAPALQPTLWYGMPAYARNGNVLCFFRADKYMTFGLTDKANHASRRKRRTNFVSPRGSSPPSTSPPKAGSRPSCARRQAERGAARARFLKPYIGPLGSMNNNGKEDSRSRDHGRP